MAVKPKTDDAKVCSFCHKGKGEGDPPVTQLTHGRDPNGVAVAICDQCIGLMRLVRDNAVPPIPIPTKH